MSPGRPPKPLRDRRTIRKGIAFSQAEYDRLCTTALKLRMDVNQFIRLMVLPSVNLIEFERSRGGVDGHASMGARLHGSPVAVLDVGAMVDSPIER